MLGGPPALLSGRWIDFVVTADELRSVAALAPADRKVSSVPRAKKPGGKSVLDRAQAYVEKIPGAVAGEEGHKQTFAVACAIVLGFDLSIDQARPIFSEYNERCQPPWSDAELEHKLLDAEKSDGERGYLVTSTSPFSSREIIQLDYSQNTFEPIYSPLTDAAIFFPIDNFPLVDEPDPLASISLSLEPEVSPTADDQAIIKKLPPLATVKMEWMDPRTQDGRTDIANCKRLMRLIEDRAHYVPAWDSWVIWNGKRWLENPIGIREFAKEVPGTILAAAISATPVDTNACNWAIESASRRRIDAMVTLVKSEPSVQMKHTELNSNPWLLNCQNGVVDLRTGELKPHDPSDKITCCAPVNYNPEASTYEWDRFLEKILIDDGLIRHVQRLIGYCITGSTREQILPIFWGEGSNGKSTLLDTLKMALGTDYASTAPPSLILQKKNESHPTELAGLCGKRMVTAIETEKGQRLNEPLVKQLTGSDAICARRMRENFWEFQPTHKLILCTNHEPRVGDDFAIWRRLLMIPFTVQFWNPDKGESGPEELKRDNDLPERLKQSLEGVLAWAVQGAVDWYRDGLGTDKVAKGATDDYRKRQDVFGQFVEDVCIVGESYKTRFSQLYEYYEDWAEEQGERKLSAKAFGEWLAKRGFEKKRSSGVWVLGITWHPDYDKMNHFDQFKE